MKDEPTKKDSERLDEMKKEIDEVLAKETVEAADAEGVETVPNEEGAPAEDKPIDELAAEMTKLKDALAEKEARVLRLQADFENFRRRTAKEKEELAAVVIQNFMTDLLPLVDNFDRAMAVSGDNEAFHKGMEMIHNQLGEILKNNGLEKIEAEGVAFDPNFHQAVMRVENPDMEDGMIAQELQKGYQVKGRVIRPSMVQVVSNS